MNDLNDSSIKYMEEISLNAWPSHKSELYDGWIIRYSHNYTYRTNSVEQVGESSIPILEKIEFCENAYRHHGTPASFKINPLMDPAFDKMLEERGYEIKHVTEVMTGELAKMHPMTPDAEEYDFENRLGMPSCMRFKSPYAGTGTDSEPSGQAGSSRDAEPSRQAGSGREPRLSRQADTSSDREIAVLIQPVITDEWITGLFHLNGTSEPLLRRIVPAMFKAIPKKTIVCSIEIDGHMVASGLGICDREYVGVYAIYVSPSCRRRGYARVICSALIIEGARQGATKAYLQVVQHNTSAKSLYRDLGFDDFYTYWFRSKVL